MNHTVRYEDLVRDVRTLEQGEVALQEVARVATQELAHIAVEMVEAERLIGRKSDMLDALNRLQIKAQEKNKGLFESLLTNLVQEVMPGKQDQVVLTSTLKNNRASLDFDILCDGNLENISEDKGGSIANIVAMGLRFIVLARHPNRRVLLLDEADCHLKGEYIPAFAAVMRQLAVKMGIQVIYISHHTPNNFIGYARVHELYSDKGKTHSRILHEESPEDRDIESMSAFRYIRLRDYGPHENLFVDLSPGLNVITGDIDLGKSKVIQAVVDLLVNNGEERRIRHGRPAFNVEIGLEEGMSLHWQYQRKGSKRTLMSLKDVDGNVIETSDLGTSVPEWLDRYLSMPLINGENIHFQSQKQPNYLLSSSDYTSIKRAEMLPLGRESRDVLRMIQLFNVRLNAARNDYAALQKRMLNVKNTLAILAPVLDEPLDMDKLQQGVGVIKDMLNSEQRLGQMCDQMQSVEDVLGDIDQLLEVAQGERCDVVLRASTSMPTLISGIALAQDSLDALSTMSRLPTTPAEPGLHDLSVLREAGKKIGALTELSSLLESLSGMESAADITLKAHLQMGQTIAQIGELEAKQFSIVTRVEQCKQSATKLATSKASLFAKLGGVCPTCDKPMQEHA